MPTCGRWIIRDMIDEMGNLLLRENVLIEDEEPNLYAFVKNNTINFIDPKGLNNYKGYCRYISGGEIIGVGIIRCKVWTTVCNKDRTREEGELVAVFCGLTAGLAASVTYFNIDQYSTSSSQSSLSELEGSSAIVTISGALGFGISFTKLKLGKTTGDASGLQAGIDISIDAFIGHSWLEQIKFIDCCSGNETN